MRDAKELDEVDDDEAAGAFFRAWIKSATRSDFSIPWNILSLAPRDSISDFKSAIFIVLGSSDDDVVDAILNEDVCLGVVVVEDEEVQRPVLKKEKVGFVWVFVDDVDERMIGFFLQRRNEKERILAF